MDGSRLIATINGAPTGVLPRVAAAILRVRMAQRTPTGLRLNLQDRMLLVEESYATIDPARDLTSVRYLMGLPVERHLGPSAVIWSGEEPLTPEKA